jgi:DNA replication and repair protein RecF
LARQLPLVFISADSQRLLSDGAEMRRRQLDWLMFHVEPNYQQLFTRYRRALGQRNALLRVNGSSDRDEQLAWAQEMASAGEQLHALRQHRFSIAEPVLQAALKDLGSIDLEFVYKAGWDTRRSLAEVLQSGWDADRSRGYSGYGPHRADLQFMVDGRPAQHVVSRGEGKVLVFAVLVAFARVLASSVQVRPLMLVDELASELDCENRERFLAALRELQMQTFITTVSQDLVNPSGWERVCMCSLSQGEVVQVLQ